MRTTAGRRAAFAVVVAVLLGGWLAVSLPRDAGALGGTWIAFVRDPSGGFAF